MEPYFFTSHLAGRRLAGAAGRPRILLAATRSGYARLERQAFGASPAAQHTRHVPDHTFRSSPGGTMFQSDPGRLAGPHRQAQRDARAHAVRRSRPGTCPHTAWSRSGTRLSRFAAALAAVTVGLLASAASPAAFAGEIPPGPQRRSPVAVASATVHHAVAAGGMTGWQIALIGVGVPLAAVVVTVLLRRVRAARRAVSSSAD